MVCYHPLPLALASVRKLSTKVSLKMRTKDGAIAVRAKCQRKFVWRERKSVNCELAFYRGSGLAGEGATAGLAWRA